MVNDALVSGSLVPDEFVRLIGWDFISKHKNDTKGFIFEGYPRSESQYKHLQEMLKATGKKLDFVILINIPEEETTKRLSDRETCEKCGEVFNSSSRKPEQIDICNVCGGRLVRRKDDQPDAIKKRLEIFWQQTKPIFEMAKTEGIGIEIDGMKSIQDVNKEIKRRIYNEEN
jgi:adenylate kinase